MSDKKKKNKDNDTLPKKPKFNVWIYIQQTLQLVSHLPLKLKTHYILHLLYGFFNRVLGLVNFISLGPYLAIINEPGLIQRNMYLRNLFEYIGLPQKDFILLLGYSLLFLIIFNQLNTVVRLFYDRYVKINVSLFLSEKVFSYAFQSNIIQIVSMDTPEFMRRYIGRVGTFNGAIFHISEIFITVINFVVTFVILISVDPFVFMMLIFILGLGYGGSYFFTRERIYRVGMDLDRLGKAQNKHVLQAIHGIFFFILMNKSKWVVKKFIQNRKKLLRVSTKKIIYTGITRPFIQLVVMGSLISYLLTIIHGGGDIAPIIAKLSVFVLALLRMMPQIQSLYSTANRVKQVEYVFTQEYDTYLKALKCAYNGNSRLARMSFSSEIKLENVYFRYQKSHSDAISGLSLTIPRGGSLAFVGDSGSGKTTLVKLILGFFLPYRGHIYIDGRQLNIDNVQSWFLNIGFVSQDVFVTNGTIEENIVLGSTNIDYDRLNKAVDAAQLREYIDSSPDGFKSLISERGRNLSGGQAQRLAIARVFYQDPPVVILDEATSVLDGITEKKLVQNVINMFKGKTIIVVAHRLSTVRFCDKICLIDKGTIKNFGTYDELLETSPHFQKMNQALGIS